jgi:cbb3-type cytochrome c oxidase subunit III
MRSLLHKRMISVGRATILVGCAVLGTSALANAEQENTRGTIDDPQIAGAWRALRIVNCDRCHGKHYEGLSAPSIVDFVRSQSREMFFRMLLDGDPPRGMPGYRDNPLVSSNIDAIYRYFSLRANGAILASSRPKPD